MSQENVEAAERFVVALNDRELTDELPTNRWVALGARTRQVIVARLRRSSIYAPQRSGSSRNGACRDDLPLRSGSLPA